MREVRSGLKNNQPLGVEEHPFDGVRIPDGWSPEVALAVSGALMALESAIWNRYGEEMIPLIALDDDDGRERHAVAQVVAIDEDQPF